MSIFNFYPGNVNMPAIFYPLVHGGEICNVLRSGTI